MKAHRFTLADDDPNALFLLHRMLTRLYPGSSIAMFSAAEDALSHVLNTGTDILITNHGMGEMSGIELIRELRLRNWNIPIVMRSGSPTAEQEALSAGATKFVDKGMAPRVFEANIRALVDVLETNGLSERQGEHHPPLERHSPRPTHKATKQ